MRIRVITTGGTIDKVYFDAMSAFQIGDPQVEPILRDSSVSLDIVVESVLKKDSLELTDADRDLIRARAEAAPERHILITHGTDTMTQTAAVLGGLGDKVIVLTGAMQPARFRQSDAAFNLGCAVGALNVLGSGVYIAMSGLVAPAHTLKKNRTQSRFERH